MKEGRSQSSGRKKNEVDRGKHEEKEHDGRKLRTRQRV